MMAAAIPDDVKRFFIHDNDDDDVDIEDNQSIHALTDDDLFSYEMKTAIGKKAVSKVEELLLFFEVLQDNKMFILSKTERESVVKEFYHLLGTPTDACYCYGALEWSRLHDELDDEEEYSDEESDEVIGLVHSPFAHVVPPFDKWYPLLTGSWSSMTVSVLIDMLEESLDLLNCQMKLLQNNKPTNRSPSPSCTSPTLL